MEIIDLILAGAVATIVLTLIIKNTSKLGLHPTNWDVLEDGVAPLMHLSKIQVYVMHVVAEVLIFPLLFISVWQKKLNLSILDNVIVSAAIFAFCIFVLASIVPILKAPASYKVKAILSLFLGRIAYGITLGLVLSNF